MKKIETIAIAAIVISAGILAWIMFEPQLKKIQLPFLPKQKITKAPEVSEELAVPQTVEEDAVAVRVVKVEPRDFQDVLPALGTVKGYAEINLKFEVAGVLKSLEVKEADRVKKGDLIATLDNTDASLKLQYARKKLESAHAQFLSANKKRELYEGLYRAGAIIRQKLDEAILEAEAVKSQEGMAEAEIKLAEAELQKVSLYAPKDGVIGSKDVEVGEFITPQNKALSLYDLAKVFVEIGVVEKDIEKVKLGQRVEVKLDSYPNEAFVGNIDNILPVIEGKSRTLTAKITLDNSKGLLLPGMFSRATIYLNEIINAIFVPQASIIPLGEGVNVIPVVDPAPYLIQEVEKGIKPGIVHLRKVTLGYASTDYVHASEGLETGDLVIIEAKGEIQDGLKVKIVGLEEMVM